MGQKGKEGLRKRRYAMAGHSGHNQVLYAWFIVFDGGHAAHVTHLTGSSTLVQGNKLGFDLSRGILPLTRDRAYF